MFYIYADNVMIYHLANPELYLVNPTLNLEMGKAGSLEFGIKENHPYYSKLAQLRTLVRVEFDQVEIFRGRVLSNKREFDNTRTIYCEGDLSFLIDSVQSCEKYEGTTHALFRKIIANHNSRVEAYKQFTVGNITIEDRPIKLEGRSDDINVGAIDYKQIAIDSIVGEWNNTYDFIETCLIDYCGGYLKTRRVNGINYIDYVQSYAGTATQPISIGSNVFDLEEEITAEDLFTVLIPLGDEYLTIKDVNGGSDELVDAAAVAQYGRIVQTHVFNNVNEPSTLLENGQRYLASHVNVPRTLTVKAIDLHIFNENITQINLGDQVQIRSTPHNIAEALTCTEIEYDLENPMNTTYTFGNPRQTLTERYREDKRKESDTYGNSGGGSGKSSSAGGISGWHLIDAADATTKAAEEKAEDDFNEFYKKYIDLDESDGNLSLKLVAYENKQMKKVLGWAGIDVSVNDGASVINLETLRQGITDNRALISATSDDLQSEIRMRTDVTDALTSTVEQHYTEITQRSSALESEINLKAAQSYVQEIANDLSTTKEILQNEAGIDLSSNPERANVSITALSRRVDENNSAIRTNSANISTLADGFGGTIDLVVSSIKDNIEHVGRIQLKADANETAIMLKADKIEVDGKLTALRASIDDLIATKLTADWVKSTIANLSQVTVKDLYASGGVHVNSINASSISLGADGTAVLGANHVHNVVESNGYITIGTATTSTGNNSFKIADTNECKRLVSAAEKAVRIKSISVDTDVDITYNSSNKTLSIPLTGQTDKGTPWTGTISGVNAYAAWKAGYDYAMGLFETVDVTVQGTVYPYTVYTAGSAVTYYKKGNPWSYNIHKVGTSVYRYERQWRDGDSVTQQGKRDYNTHYKKTGATKYESIGSDWFERGSSYSFSGCWEACSGGYYYTDGGWVSDSGTSIGSSVTITPISGTELTLYNKGSKRTYYQKKS